jgi:CDP-glycerol glycerophosphotransferase (TagB/SpsB family)
MDVFVIVSLLALSCLPFIIEFSKPPKPMRLFVVDTEEKRLVKVITLDWQKKPDQQDIENLAELADILSANQDNKKKSTNYQVYTKK